MIEVACVGDVMLARGVGERLARGCALLAPAVRETLARADVRCANLESPLARRAVPTESGGFRAAPPAAAELEGFDVVSLANNHIFDCGAEGIDETLGLLDAQGIHHVGLQPKPEDAYQPILMTVAEVSPDSETSAMRVAFFGCVDRRYSRVPDNARYAVALLQDPRLPRAVGEARRSADSVVVMCHGGNEFVADPPPTFRAAVRELCVAGASLVVTHHPHVLGGYETAGGNALIWHSLGDFVFDGRTPARRRSGILRVGLGRAGVESFQLVPTCVRDDGVVELARGDVRELILRQVESVSERLRSAGYDRAHSWNYRRAWLGFQRERLVTIGREQGWAAALRFLASRSSTAGRHMGRWLAGGHR